MELKGAEIRNLMELCNPMPKNGTENRKLNVLIPYYQRPYKWEETQIKNLFADYFKNEQKEYFVGSVVMVENHDGGFEIIDGQQRITTLFLLNYLKFIFACLHRGTYYCKKGIQDRWVPIKVGKYSR